MTGDPLAVPSQQRLGGHDPALAEAAGDPRILLREKYKKSYTCYYSKRMSFLMNRSLSAGLSPAACGALR